MRREPRALLEGAAEVEARQAGIRSQRGKGDVRIVVRVQTIDGAAQRGWRKAAQGLLKDGGRAGMCRQQACGEKIVELVPEQRIQRRAALYSIRCADQQAGRDGIGMPRSLEQFARRRRLGFTGNALERPVGKVELDDIDRPGNVPAGARAGRNDCHDAGPRRSDRRRFSVAPLQSLYAGGIRHDDVIGHRLDDVM